MGDLAGLRGWGVIGRLLRRLFCRHDYRFHRNIYGDEINVANARSLWLCHQCGAWQARPELGEQ